MTVRIKTENLVTMAKEEESRVARNARAEGESASADGAVNKSVLVAQKELWLFCYVRLNGRKSGGNQIISGIFTLPRTTLSGWLLSNRRPSRELEIKELTLSATKTNALSEIYII
jgi:hypothetical protein